MTDMIFFFLKKKAIRDTNNKRQAVLTLLHELPKEHYNTLKALMLHLNRVTSYSGVNLMSSQNLGVVFGRECLAPFQGRWFNVG